jgi:hypothetical protein
VKKKKLIALAMAASVTAGAAGFGAATTQAAAQTYPINGTKACYESAWFTSSNVRSINSGNKTIKVKVADAGTGGIKIRALRVNDNVVSNTGFYPPLDTYATLTSTWNSGTQFKFMFNCVTAGNTSSVWLGTASY